MFFDLITNDKKKTHAHTNTQCRDCLHTKSSFGDGVQYPVQMKHFPGNVVGNTSNYESMGNSYTLNKFETNANQTTDSNDSRKNLLNQNAGYRDGAPATSIEYVNSVDGQLSAVGTDADLTIVNETHCI